MQKDRMKSTVALVSTRELPGGRARGWNGWESFKNLAGSSTVSNTGPGREEVWQAVRDSDFHGGIALCLSFPNNGMLKIFTFHRSVVRMKYLM